MNGKINSILFYTLNVFNFLPVFAQYEISGIVQTPNHVLEGVSIVFKTDDNKILAYTFTDESGYFLATLPVNSCIVELNFIGHKQKSEIIKFSNQNKVSRNFFMEESIETMEPIVIKYEQPVTLKGDTLVFNAKLLGQGHEMVVEDLLRNIPGIVISKEGKIYYNDTEVENVMIEGDDLFNKGYSLLTQNMPSKPLKTVEILRRFSNNKLLKGIESSEKVALNLTIDDDAKNLWFGNIKASYGNKERYLVNANLMRFTKRFKTFANSSADNTGLYTLGAVNEMVYNSGDVETIGLGFQAQSSMRLGLVTANLDQERTRFNNTRFSTISSIFPVTSKSKLKILGYIGFDKLNAFSSSINVTDFQNTIFTNIISNNGSEKLKKAYLNAFFTCDFSNNSMLQLTTTLKTGTNQFSENYIFNDQSTIQNLDTKSELFDQKLTFTHRWKDKHAIVLKARFFTDKLPQDYDINKYLLGELFENANDINSTENHSRNSKQYAGLNATFMLKKKNSDIFRFDVGLDSNTDVLVSRFTLLTNSSVLQPGDFQSNTTFHTKMLYANTSYFYQIRNISIQGNIKILQQFNEFINSIRQEVSQTPFYLIPTVNLKWDFRYNQTVAARYSYNFFDAQNIQVIDAYVLQSSNSFTKGLGYFNQLESHQADISYTKRHYLNRYNLTIAGEFAKQNNEIVYNSQLNQASSLSQAEVIKGGDKLGIKFSSHYVIRSVSSIINFDASTNRLTYFNKLNGSTLRENILYTQHYSLRWSSNFKAAFNFKLNSNWHFSKVKSDFTIASTTKINSLDLNYKINEKLNFQWKTDHYNFGALNQQQDYFFSDFKSNYILKKDKLILSIQVRNLFNTTHFTTYNISDYGYGSNSYQLLPRYIVGSLDFKF